MSISPNITTRKIFSSVIGLLISAVFVYLAFKGIHLDDLGRSIQQADFRWVLSGLGIYSIGYVIRAVRWQGLLRPVQWIPATQLAGPLILGFFANNILPFRMGELVRAHVCGRKFDISRASSLASIVVERVFDTVTFLVIFLTVAIFF